MMTPRQELLARAAELRRHVADLLAAGESCQLCAGEPARETRTASPPPAAGLEAGSPLACLAQEAAACRRCALSQSRKQVVFGEGDPQAELVFVGEAPGAEEDREGRPFVGQAGKLLTRIIESIGLTRDGVYICNVLKCRPPGNRNPLPAEIAACRYYLEKQLGLLRPKLICALGTFAAQTLLATTEPIGRLRGKTFDFLGLPVVPTLHPAALLYHPQNKRLVWEDMKVVVGKLRPGAKLPKAGER